MTKEDKTKTLLWLGEERQPYVLIDRAEKVEQLLRSGAMYFIEFETVTGDKLFIKPSGVNWFFIKEGEK